MFRKDLTSDEVDNYFGTYILKVAPELDILTALRGSGRLLLDTVSELSEEQLNYRYEEGKWTIKEIVVHLIDTERIFNYRALRFARKDSTPLPGFEQDDYVANCYAQDRSIDSLIDEFETLRRSTCILFENMTPAVLKSKGKASDLELTVRSIGFIQSGHVIHHVKIIKERYL